MSSGNSEESASEKISASEYVPTIYQRFIARLTAGQERRGQAWMNALHDVDPELYASIHGTEADCFYDDRKIDAFRKVVFGA